MQPNRFENFAMTETHPDWNVAIARIEGISKKEGDIRSEFSRDYQRILHCNGYSRLKHKTQVFFATQHDHICTRIEHVNHVASVSYTIARYLGLNTELTNAIAIGHDLGHPPFGHTGEKIIKGIASEETGVRFWHERNSLRFVDEIITLEDRDGMERNLDLTYAVRDGIVSHCGEVNANGIRPRGEAIGLDTIDAPGKFEPFTWEGCVVKIADKISYLGRDIEDAVSLRFLSEREEAEFKKLVRSKTGLDVPKINNSYLMHNFVIDLCGTSSPDAGIGFSAKYLALINSVKDFNYEHIYEHKRMNVYHDYAALIIRSLYSTMKEWFAGAGTIDEVGKHSCYPMLSKTFMKWLWKYSDANPRAEDGNRYANKVVYRIADEMDFRTAILDYIAGMTDQFAIKLFDELTTF